MVETSIIKILKCPLNTRKLRRDILQEIAEDFINNQGYERKFSLCSGNTPRKRWTLFWLLDRRLKFL